MTIVAIQPAASGGAQEHYKNTVASRVNISDYRSEAGADFEVLAQVAKDGRVALWGVTAGKRGVNAKKYQKLSVGDVVLFTKEKHVFSSGRISALIQNPRLAKAVWDSDDSGETWEYMYALDDVRPQRIPYSELSQAIGSSLGDNYMGFRPLDPAKSRAALSLLGIKDAAAEWTLTVGQSGEIALPGTAPDAPVGSVYPSRNELSDSGVHGVRMQGIWTADKVAIGIVLNGGYEDDVDEGDRIIYTGDGGRDAATGKQVADQELTAGNRGLAAAMDQGLPIRVSRGRKLESTFAPADGFRYDGMYRVEDRDYSRGAEGFYVWKFLLVRDPAADQITMAVRAGDALGSLQPGRKSSQIERVIRSSAVADAVKKLYDFTCQMCGLRLEKATGGYAEGAHIRPLGMLHSGPDVLSNILCLCPNDHVLFDDGAIWIDEALARVGPTGGVEGKLVVRRRTGEVVRDLAVHREHRIDLDQIRYHQEHRDSGTRRLERARNLAASR